MGNRKGDDRYTWFQGARLSTIQANRVGFAAIFATVGILIAGFTLDEPRSYVSPIIIVCLVVAGYWLAGKVFKERSKQ